VPVLTHRMLHGEVIGQASVEWTQVPADRLQPDVIVRAEDLVGKTPRRGLAAGVPVRMGQLRLPVVVRKGGLVTLILKSPRMMLTARGRALMDASRGDAVRVVNTQSHTVVEGLVVAAGQVVVRPGPAIAEVAEVRQ